MREQDKFFAYARARHKVQIAREIHGKPFPWTGDPVLRNYRFCSVFREDDATTRWIAKHVRGPLDEHQRATGEQVVVPGLVVARWFNRVTTLERLVDDPVAVLGRIDLTTIYDRVRDVKPLVTGAFMINTPPGMDKLHGLMWCFARFSEFWNEELSSDGFEFPPTTEAAVSWLSKAPRLGRFMAYEVVCDLHYTSVLSSATDRYTWASAGPGAFRGASRVARGYPEYYKRGVRWDEEQVMSLMLRLLEASRFKTNWPKEWEFWDMRTVEHTLCEYDKYRRAQQGGSLKRRYEPSR